ncbi:MAG: PAS domain S-box protein, partial [Opitutaceae bacterium]
ALLRGTASGTGEEFARILVRELAQALGIGFVFLGKRIQGPGRRIRTVAFWANGRLVDNIEYDLAGTPCEFALGNELKLYTKDLAGRFPKDDLIAQMKIESYLGVPLLARDGRSIGNLVAMDTQAMPDNPALLSLFNIFAARASVEMERADALDALAESADRFKRIVENSRAGFFRLGLDGRYEDVNRSWLDMHGYASCKEVIGKHFSFTQVESDLPEASAIVEQVLSGRGHPPGDFTHRRKDGSVGYHTYSACAVMHEGRIVGLECFLIDTTALRRVEADYAMLFNEMTDAFAIHEIICDKLDRPIDFRYVTVNPAFERLTGRKAAEIVGRTIKEIELNVEAQCIEKLGRVALSGASTTFEHFDATFGRLLSVNAFQSAPRRVACTFTDITERKRAENDLAQDEAELAAIHEHVPMMLLLIDKAGKVRRYNRTAVEFSSLFDTQEKMETAGSFLRCIHAFDSDAGCGQGLNCANCILRQACTDSIEAGRSHHREECVLCLMRGEQPSDISLRFSTAQVRIGNDSLVLLCLEDITPQKEAEARIVQQAALLDITRDAICVLSSDYAIEYWNRGAETIFGWAATEATGCDWETLIFKQESPEFRKAWAIIIEKGEWMGELLALSKEGDGRTLQCRGTRVDPAKGGPVSVLLVCTDITESKQLETQFFHMQRIESLGSIASGIAHDLNNILSPIMMSVDLLPSRLTTPEDAALIEMLRASAHRGSEIVQQLLLFSRGSDTPRQPLNPGSIVIEMAGIVRQTFPRNITLITEVPQGLWEVLADSTQIHQVLLNLCVNARDAMNDRGTLRLHVENVTLQPDRTDTRSGSFVLIRISDTGCGIAPDHLNRIFDPFFTTKPVGKGTGLGLSTALGIVKSHGGFIQVKSQPGLGTEFCVYLPAVLDETPPAQPNEQESYWQGNGELILVVDDERNVQQLLDLALVKHNYRVIHAADGANAVAMFAQHVDDVRVVITDMMMPHMDGMLAIKCLRQINPTIPIIAMSGMHEQMTALEKDGEPDVRFIFKPFTVKKMLALLHELLIESEAR